MEYQSKASYNLINRKQTNSKNTATATTTAVASNNFLSLVFNPDISSSHTFNIPPVNSKKKLLELQNVDFLGNIDDVKQLFNTPSHKNDDKQKNKVFAFHRLGNTLLIDSVDSIKGIAGTIDFDHNDTRKKQQNENIKDPYIPFDSRNSRNDSRESKYQFNDLSPSPQSLVTEALQQLLIENEESSSRSSQAHTQTGLRHRHHQSILIDNNSSYGCSHGGISSTNSTIANTQVLKAGSQYLPPPAFYGFNDVVALRPSKQLVQFQLHEIKLALGSDITVYNTEFHPSFTLKTVDTMKELEISTCLDMYLDNVLTNVPELAYALHSKGFVRGIHACHTRDIPYLHHSYAHPADYRLKKETPIFDPEVIDMDASAIMRFLKENCSNESSTYILSYSANGDSLHLYDLSTLENSKQKRFKWMLAMISYRFAIKLGHHIKHVASSSKSLIRQRQLQLLSSCYSILEEIKAMGGEDHGSIKASVLEQMADVHLSRVDEAVSRLKMQPSPLFNSVVKTASTTTAKSECKDIEYLDGANRSLKASHGADEFDDEDDVFDTNSHLQDAIHYLCDTVTTLSTIISSSGGGSGSGSSNNGNGNEDEESNANGNDDDNDDGSSHEIFDSLNLQLTGVLYKLIQSIVVITMEYIKNASIADALKYLSKLLLPCSLWTHLQSKRIKNPSDSYSVNMTIRETLPCLWTLIGETLREVTKQTSGVSSHNPHNREIMYSLIENWRLVSYSIFNHECNSSDSSCNSIRSNASSSTSSSTLGGKKSKKCSKRKKKSCAVSASINCKDELVLNDWLMWQRLIASHSDVSVALESVHRIVAKSVLLNDCTISVERASTIYSGISDAPIKINEEMQLLFQTAYCFLCGTLSYYQSQHTAINASRTQESVGNKSYPLSAQGNDCNFRRLGDICNLIGQRLVQNAVAISKEISNCEVTTSSNDSIAYAVLMLFAEETYVSALSLFNAVGDMVNATMVRCNLICLLRIKAAGLSNGTFKFLLIRCPNAFNYKVETDLAYLDRLSCTYRQMSPTACLDEALEQCTIASNLLTVTPTGSNYSSITAAVKSETAICHFNYALMNRVFYKSGNKDLYDSILASLYTSLKLFEELGNSRQSASVRYQLGSHYSASWPFQANPLDVLQKGLLYYKEAHSYYSRYDVSPTLVLILIDMCDLYLASYKTIEATVSTVGSCDSDGNEKEWDVDRNSIVSILGGAFQSIVETRFAFTSRVSEIHGQEQMKALSNQVRDRMLKVLLKVLKAESNGVFAGTVTTTDSLLRIDENIKEVKRIYSELLKTTNSFHILEQLNKNEWLKCVLTVHSDDKPDNV